MSFIKYSPDETAVEAFQRNAELVEVLYRTAREIINWQNHLQVNGEPIYTVCECLHQAMEEHPHWKVTKAREIHIEVTEILVNSLRNQDKEFTQDISDHIYESLTKMRSIIAFENEVIKSLNNMN